MKTSCWQQSTGAIVLALICQSRAYASETLLVHGHIYTGNVKMPWAEALAVTRTRIDAIGTDKDVAYQRVANTKVIDLQGRTVIPGIVDSHVQRRVRTLERAVLMCRGNEIQRADLGLDMLRPQSQNLEELSLESVEAILIRKALQRSQGNVSQAAETLGLSRGALYRRMEKYGL